jgi:D-alanyl-D-alanine carboxypeptidase (penicillin-binding protein 5/6)
LRLRAFVALVVLAAIYVGVQALRPTPNPTVRPLLPTTVRIGGASPALPWPGMGEAAVEINRLGSLGSSGGDTPIPVASLAKVMTAYVVLHDHPLGPAQQGPSLTVTAADVALYQREKADGESVVAVTAGERLTERQALEAALIPSGNDAAIMLAKWDAGSVSAFVHKMNATASALGLHHTRYVEPSGADPASTSTASDQVSLGLAAMTNPVFASIVGSGRAVLPVAGVVFNVNSLLGHDGIDGIKTGFTIEGGSNLLFSAHWVVDGRRLAIIGAVMGQHGATPLETTFGVTSKLVRAAAHAVRMVTVLPAGTRVAEIDSPGRSAVPATLSAPLRLLGWPGLAVAATFAPTHVGGTVSAGQQVGQLTLQFAGQRVSGPVRASRAVQSPPLTWRLQQI